DDPEGAFGPLCRATRRGDDAVSRTVSIDEWLKADEISPIVFELSTVAGRDDLVRVTPWLRAVVPLAALSLDLPRTAIAGVRPATEGMASHARLVHLEFRPESAISLDQLYHQIGGRISVAGPVTALLYAVARGDIRLVRDFVSGAGVTAFIIHPLM